MQEKWMKKLFGQHIYLGIWWVIFLAISIVFLIFDFGLALQFLCFVFTFIKNNFSKKFYVNERIAQNIEKPNNITNTIIRNITISFKGNFTK